MIGDVFGFRFAASLGCVARVFRALGQYFAVRITITPSVSIVIAFAVVIVSVLGCLLFVPRVSVSSERRGMSSDGSIRPWIDLWNDNKVGWSTKVIM